MMPDGLSPRGTDAGSAQPSRPALCSRRRVRAEDRTRGGQLCPYRVTNSGHAKKGCSQAARLPSTPLLKVT